MSSYSEMIKLPTFEERFEYLAKHAGVGDPTFRGARHLNQTLYQSQQWRAVRDKVIIRDNGCDLAIPDRTIYGKILIHHIEAITIEDVVYRSEKIFDLNNLVAVSFQTHEAIHFGDISLCIPSNPLERKPGDTCLWR